MVGRRPCLTMRASSSAMASVSSYSGREAYSLAAARCRRTDGVKRSRSTQVATTLAGGQDTIGPSRRSGVLVWAASTWTGLEVFGVSPSERKCITLRRAMVVVGPPRG
jgi:hypothetical protein